MLRRDERPQAAAPLPCPNVHKVLERKPRPCATSSTKRALRRAWTGTSDGESACPHNKIILVQSSRRKPCIAARTASVVHVIEQNLGTALRQHVRPGQIKSI